MRSLIAIVKKSLRKLFRQPLPISTPTIPSEAKLSFSQEGEDMILERFFERKQGGFYVDIGAHHPLRFSNTYHFYCKGWRGINVDATPGSMTAFNQLRPRDINVETGVASKAGDITYYLFEEPALNTFSKERVDYLLSQTPYKLKGSVPVKTMPLSELLAVYLPPDQAIDFLTIDVEGLDFEILQSNNWSRFKPHFILVEDLGGSLEKLNESPLNFYLKDFGYTPVAKTHNTLFFRLKPEA